MSIGRQISAGRGLLRWSGSVLADKAGLTRDTINKIEADAVQPREGTVADIVRVFDEHGVEFIENSGVRLKPQGVEILLGKSGLQDFFNAVFEHARKYGGVIVQLGIDENQFVDVVGADFAEAYNKRMTKLVEDRKDIKALTILREGDTNLLFSDYNQYRWISKDIFARVPFYIYGDTLAIMDFHTVPTPTIILLKFPAITKAYRKQFDAFWKMSSEPIVPDVQKPVSKPKKGRSK